MKNKKFFTIMIGLLLIVTLFVGGCSAKNNLEEDNVVESDEKDYFEEEDEEEDIEEKKQYDIETGKPAPNFILENINGEEVSLEDYKGKIVMLNFWATWCPYCVKEMPDMNTIQEENDDLVILAVNIKEEKNKVKKYIEEGGYEFEVVLDTEGTVGETYLVGNLPTSYFIDKEGILIGGIPGMLEYPQMKQIIEGIRKDQ